MKSFITIKHGIITIEVSVERVEKPGKPLVELNIPLPKGEINLKFDILLKLWKFSHSLYFYLRLY